MMKMHYRKKKFFSNVQHFDKIFLVAAHMEPEQRLLILKKVSLSLMFNFGLLNDHFLLKKLILFNWPFDFNNQVIIEF